MRHGGSDLSLGEIEKITAKIGFLPFLTITGGEPFLRDDLLDICELFYYNCDTRFISIVTNGIRSSAIIATVEELLIDCRHLKLTVIVALDDLDGSHDLIKKVSGCYEQAENTLKNLSNLKLRFPRLAIGINTMVLKENTGHLDTILDYFTIHYHCDRYALNLLREPPGTSNESSLISLGEYARLMKVINGKSGYGSSLLKQRINRELWEYCFKKSLEEFRLRRAVSPCLAGQKFIVIGNNGSIYGCELRPEGLGNIRASAYNLRNIIKDKSAENFRKDVKVQGCYCQWPCAAVCNAILTPPAYGGILKRLIFH
jgi:radical SAM protein with 4Fe4S-binding SPASM domain